MAPKKKVTTVDREGEAVAHEEQKSAKLSQTLFDEAIDSRMASRVRPSSLQERVPSKLLRRSDCKAGPDADEAFPCQLTCLPSQLRFVPAPTLKLYHFHS